MTSRKDKRVEISTKGDYSPGIVQRDFIVNQTIVQEHKKASKRKNWRSLETVIFPLLRESEHSREVFLMDLAFALDQIFQNKGYVKFNAIFRMQTIIHQDQERPYYELKTHQASFGSRVERNYNKFLQTIEHLKSTLPIQEAKQKMRQLITNERREFQAKWRIQLDVGFSNHWVPIELIYDPETVRISIRSIDTPSINFGEYADSITTSSEMLCFVAAASRTVFGFFGDLIWLEGNYPLLKLNIDILDNRSINFDNIRINVDDVEEWDYINKSFDEEVKNREHKNGSTSNGNDEQ